MKQLFAIFALSLSAYAADAAVDPQVCAVPFEPPIVDFFRMDDRFAHPPELIAPRFLFPFEFRRGGGAVTPGEVVILVQLDGRGRAKQLKVLSSRHEFFTRSALEALKKAKWDSASESWFYYRHVYTLDEFKRPNQPPEPTR